MRHQIILRLALVLSGILSGCATHQTSPSPNHEGYQLIPKKGGVFVVPGNVIDPLALKQLDPPITPPVLTLQHPANVILKVLPEIQKISRYRIAAVTEDKGWYWFAISASTSGDRSGFDGAKLSEAEAARENCTFISGYAVRKGSRDVFYWSIW